MNDDIEMNSGKFETPPGHKAGYVAVIGRPNVGKSTLMNAFLQEKPPLSLPGRKRRAPVSWAY